MKTMSKDENINKLREFSFIDSSIVSLKKIHFKPQDMVDLIDISIEKSEWLTVAKCVAWIQMNPSKEYVNVLCRLLSQFYTSLNPEEVVDALGDVLEFCTEDNVLIYAVFALAKAAEVDYEADDSFHINTKCLDILHWVAGSTSCAGSTAMLSLEKLSKIGIQEVADEARECLQDLEKRTR